MDRYSLMDLVDTLIKSVATVYGRTMSREGKDGLPIQSGALPWRLGKRKKAEVMLVTGRRSKRWLIPKGWPIDGKSLAESAELEAFEEAGIKGKVDPDPIGRFRHFKQHVLLGDMEVEILVHPMAVKRELNDWPERGERLRKWFEIREAAERVDSDGLRALIRRLGDSLKQQSKRKKAADA